MELKRQLLSFEILLVRRWLRLKFWFFSVNIIMYFWDNCIFFFVFKPKLWLSLIFHRILPTEQLDSNIKKDQFLVNLPFSNENLSFSRKITITVHPFNLLISTEYGHADIVILTLFSSKRLFWNFVVWITMVKPLFFSFLSFSSQIYDNISTHFIDFPQNISMKALWFWRILLL